MTDLCQSGSLEPHVYEIGLDYQTVDIGILYKHASGLSMGMMIKHLVGISESKYSSVTRPKGADFKLPHQVTIGVASKVKSLRLSVDNEFIYGDYGGQVTKQAKFWFIRAGAERKMSEHVLMRAGLIFPVVAWTNTLGDVQDDMPWPKLALTCGLGLRWGPVTVDAALSGDHGRSYIEKKINLKGVVTSTLSF